MRRPYRKGTREEQKKQGEKEDPDSAVDLKHNEARLFVAPSFPPFPPSKRVCFAPEPGMLLSEDRTKILVNGKPKYSARSIRFLLGSDVCVLCIASAASGSVSSRCAECGDFPNSTVHTGFRLNEHRLDGKMRKPRTREVTKIEQDDFDNEAKQLFKNLGLDESGRGHVEHEKYCPINEIHRRFTPPPRPPCSCARTRSRAEARLLCSRGEGKGTIFVGNKGVASTRHMLEEHNITHIVNCTVSRSTFRAPMPTRVHADAGSGCPLAGLAS